MQRAPKETKHTNFLHVTYIFPWYFSGELGAGQMEAETSCLAKLLCWIDLMPCWIGLHAAPWLWDVPLCPVLGGSGGVLFGFVWIFSLLKIINLDLCAFSGCNAGCLCELKYHVCILIYDILLGKILSSFSSSLSCVWRDRSLCLKCSYTCVSSAGLYCS